jgi:hypothetical protein
MQALRAASIRGVGKPTEIAVGVSAAPYAAHSLGYWDATLAKGWAAAEHVVDIDQARAYARPDELVCMDSPLEEDGFELAVPPRREGL